MTEYLLLINIGPVQEFIAAARRSRDLWYGSWLLSELGKAAARAIAEQHGIDSLIFPAPSDPSALEPTSSLIVPNKIIAHINEDPTVAAQRVEATVRSHLQTLAETALTQVKGSFLREEALGQITDLLEWYWVALPISTDIAYSVLRGQLEALATARKLTRDTRPVPYPAMKPKSSIDGLRESVIPEEQYDLLAPDAIFAQYGARRGERLSGVDLLKRHGAAAGEERFPSTSHIAAVPLLQSMSKSDTSKAQVAWASYRQALRIAGVDLGRLPKRYPLHLLLGPFEGALLFEERLAEDVSNHDKLATIQRALRTFLAEAAGGATPYPYYALLLADGDEMGKAIDAQESAEHHRAISAALDGFAARVRKLIEEEHKGALVYAGGDDVLAFLPLHTVIPCAMRLSTELTTALKLFPKCDGTPVTLSAGVVIIHHLEPLNDALRQVREAEKIAKALPGKNALTVRLSKRSGGDTTVCDHWSKLDTHLLAFAELFLDKDRPLPDGAAFELRSLAERLRPSHGDHDTATLLRAQRKEALRILGRKQSGLDKQRLDLKHEQFKVLDEAVNDPELSIEQLADELVIARELARGLAQARG